MTVRLVGFTASQLIPRNALVRLTFGTPGWDPLNYFASHMTSVWQDLPTRAGLFTTTYANVFPGAITATIDARTHVALPGASLIAAVVALNDNFVELLTVQLLTTAEVLVANTPEGTTARDAAAQTEAEKASQTSWSEWLKSTLASVGTTLKVLIVVVVLVLLVAAYQKIER